MRYGKESVWILSLDVLKNTYACLSFSTQFKVMRGVGAMGIWKGKREFLARH